MKILRTLSVLALGIVSPRAEGLREADREALLEKLEQIQKEAENTVDAKFRAAISAFKSALTSESAAVDLYLMCEEKVNFEEMQKKSSDFREWKRKHGDRLSDSGFKNALRQQLRWFILTMEAASEDPDRERLAVEAGNIVDSIMSQAEQLSPYRDVLGQGVTSTVFAKAYDINDLKVEDWPLAPLQIAQIYDQVLLPPLRQPDRLSSLRSAWQKRMLHESALVDQWRLKPGESLRPGEHTPQYDRFVADRLPELQWEAEVDLYQSGDERGAALRMLDHIEKHLRHQSAPGWVESFSTLLQGGSLEEAPEDAAP